jgi:DNA-binding response OmpR family regulator
LLGTITIKDLATPLMPELPKILLVDDEESVRVTLAPLLEREGFNVSSAATVPEALAQISQSSFDVLIADLNIGHPADGYIVVSAMRRTHPGCLNFILTGYPDFETALEAIRQHVNDYLIKPTPIDELVGKIRLALANRRTAQEPAKSKRVPDVIEENQSSLITAWLEKVHADSELMRVRLNEEDRKDHVPALLQEAVARARGENIAPEREGAPARHGLIRCKQRYSVPMLIAEARLLQDVVAQCVRHNLLVIDMTHLLSDLTSIESTIAAELESSARAFMEERDRHVEAMQTSSTSRKRRQP